MSFCCQILTDFDQVNVRTTAVIFQMNTYWLKQLSFTWFSINHVLVSNLIIRIFWGAFVSRSFTFTVPQRRNDLHLTSSEERLFLHLSISIALHCIICFEIAELWSYCKKMIFLLSVFVLFSSTNYLNIHKSKHIYLRSKMT